ncbi:MAG: sigma 54-interacting transcriptional regulator [Myxococcota bacterium]
MTALRDYTRDLRALAELAGQPDQLDTVLRHALAALRPVVPYDLAAVLALQGDELVVEVAEGPLANDQVQRHRLRLDDFPTIVRALETRKPIALEEHNHAGHEGDPYDGVLDLEHGHSCMVVPLYAADRSLGIITLDRQVCQTYRPEAVDLAGIYGQLVSYAMLFAKQSQLLNRYRVALQEQNRLLVEEAGGSKACDAFEASRSPKVRRMAELARQGAAADIPILIRGETGTGKEVLAQAIHAWSPRAAAPFVKLNCAAIPENLVESELFGHVKGAFSGAERRRQGRFLTANGGTLLLDEVGDMPLAAQAKLLRVLQEGTFEPVGSDELVRVDVRVVAASHVDLERAIEDGRFRSDLYYRLAAFPLELPALRDRIEDIPTLAEGFLDQLAQRTGRGPWRLSDAALDTLMEAPWPGNVRELVNALERATILQAEGTLEPSHLALRVGSAPAPLENDDEARGGQMVSLREHERRYLARALRRTRGKIYGSDGAARLLGLKPTTLQSKLKKHGLKD